MDGPTIGRRLRQVIAAAIAIAAVIVFLLLAGCTRPIPVGSGCEWVDPPPGLHLCEPGEAVTVDRNMIASCDAFTRPTGDWILGLATQGAEVCGWKTK